MKMNINLGGFVSKIIFKYIHTYSTIYMKIKPVYCVRNNKEIFNNNVYTYNMWFELLFVLIDDACFYVINRVSWVEQISH